MLTRREFLGSTVGAMTASVEIRNREPRAAGSLAWRGPIGLQIGTVRAIFTTHPMESQQRFAALAGKASLSFIRNPIPPLKEIAAIGYRELELAPNIGLAPAPNFLRAVGLTAPSAFFKVPRTLDDWKRAIEVAKHYDVRYMTIGKNPKFDAEGWNRQIEFFHHCGALSHAAGVQLCYHGHFHEFARIGNTTPYDMMLTRLNAHILKMEMDVFWVVYAGVDPVSYFQRYPGRFPLLHIKDLRRDFTIGDPQEPYSRQGPNPFTPVGQGRIDWRRIFAHTPMAGTKHVFVEQDWCSMPPMDAVKISFEYLKNLRLS